jgi:hypothetical protein
VFVFLCVCLCVRGRVSTAAGAMIDWSFACLGSCLRGVSFRVCVGLFAFVCVCFSVCVAVCVACRPPCIAVDAGGGLDPAGGALLRVCVWLLWVVGVCVCLCV